VLDHTDTVAVIGLGSMGRRIARRLVARGCRVVVWNRSAGPAAELVERGAIAAATPAAAAAGADFVITMVSDPPALRAVTEGREGVARGIARTATLIEMSTVGPAAIARLASVLSPATALVDAPVLGSVAEAEAGALTVFVGGADAAARRAAQLLEHLGTPVHVGPVGAGSAAKLVANAALFATVVALGEAVRLADGLGLSREAAYRVLAASPLAAQAERRRSALDQHDYPARFKLALARKDAELIEEAAAQVERDLRVAGAVSSWLDDAEASGHGLRDYTAVLAEILESPDP
jgi:3-hydroxyisobutyrate dehydrogenase-like beta-hydroxyacid dehydrogenase